MATTLDRNIAILNAAVARALIKAQGMTAENMQRQHDGISMAYRDEDFNNIINDVGIAYKDVIALMNIR